MRYVSIFSGIEAASVAWGPLGWEPMAFAEIDPFCRAVLQERFPGVPNLGDVKEVDWRAFKRKPGRPDLVVGGSPCQSFSVAGNREGLRGESGLMWEYVRAIRGLMPRWLLWENVPGALSSANGEDFRCLLESLDALGYGLAWRVLDAQFFGVAQRRERVYLVGSLGTTGACEVLIEPESMRWDPPSSREKRQELAAGAGCGAACAGFSHKASPAAGNIGFEPEQAPTLLAGRQDAAVLCIQGDVARGAHMGQNGRGYSEDGVSYTLNTMDVPAVCMSGTQEHALVSGELCGALTAHAAKDAPVVSQYGEVAGTLTARHDSSPCADRGQNVVAFVQNGRDEVRLQGGDGQVTGALAANSGMKQTTYVAGSTVRRLTPLECERLQGFPDNHTRVAYRGKPAEECPDAPRYRVLGNSMAVPVMRWIGERIQRVEGEAANERDL